MNWRSSVSRTGLHRCILFVSTRQGPDLFVERAIVDTEKNVKSIIMLRGRAVENGSATSSEPFPCMLGSQGG